MGKRYADDGKVKFQAADSKKDWEAVRQVDDKLVKMAREAKGK